MKWILKHAVHGSKPWAVQKAALEHGAGHDRYAYFLEMGLGKTALIINEFIEFTRLNRIDVCIVLAPNSFKLDWALAPAEWGHSNIPVGYWPRDPLPESGLYSVNYEAMRQGACKKGLERLIRKKRVMLVIDESAAIKNGSSHTSRAVLALAKDSVIVRELNGTPIVQNVLDFYMQLRVLGEIDGWNPIDFKNRFAILGGFMGKVVQREFKNEDELFKILGRVAFRALKKDWRKDLPEKLYTPVHLEMTKKQLFHYREMMEDFYTEVEELGVSADMVLTQMDKLRQISSCLVMQDGRHNFLEEPKANPKVQAARDIIEASLGKVVIVHNYRASGDMLFEYLQAAKLNPCRIKGRVKPEEIVWEKKKFNEDDKHRVMVAQESAAFRGHTLIGQKGDRANTMVFYENSFSFYERSQMEDRIHRGEIDENCTYYDLITSPMDQVVVDTLQGKRDMADAVDDVVKVVRGLTKARSGARLQR